ncbi:hypothetical protein RirG_203180 [Rhizophagus irregularis DAOM 197198w]|uniref:Serine-enriched protein n=4 Tax=Rhizophagus irregularis TaxID=588596 RepID=A0A015IL17_RHIIW|nr:hypothetical protein RirG_203180 [Rhizophagus irregularis DAOM 197198w]
MAAKFHSGLSRDLLLMLYNADDRNVIIRVGKNHNVKEFRAHSNILRFRSAYFKSALSSKWIGKKNENGTIKFEKPNINPNIFEIILKYIYTGEVDLTVNSGEVNLELLISSDELLLEELFNYVQDYLIEKQITWVQQNFVLILKSVYKLINCKKLLGYCLGLICVHPLPFFFSNNFVSLDTEILHELLKRDDLQVEEITVWDSLIKWGIKKAGLKDKPQNEWTDKNREDLKNTMNGIVPLIRFTYINSKDFFDKIRPYKDIIPDNIYEDMMEFYLKNTLPKSMILTPRIGTNHIESTIVKPKLASAIIKYIEEKSKSRNYNNYNYMYQRSENNQNNHKYKFDLLYRSSRDYISSDNFKNNCYRQLPCLVLVSVHSSPKIFGGYSPIGVYFCNGSQWHYTCDSFIFSFENDGDIENMKISRVTCPNYALYEFYDCAFNFGGGSMTMDNDKNLHLNDQGYYQNFQVNASYAVKEVEAFRVVKQ